MAISGIEEIPAWYFGIEPEKDSTAGFVNFANYLQDNVATKRFSLNIGPGNFYTDKIELPGSASQAVDPGGFAIKGSGPTRTKITSNTTSEPCFFYNSGGVIRQAILSGFELIGLGATNPNQMGMLLLGDPSTAGDYTGGWWNLQMDNVRVTNFNLQQVVSKGGSYSGAGNAPQQFWNLRNVSFNRAAGNHWPSSCFYGQHGQIYASNINVDGGLRTNNSGPGVAAGVHFARTRPTISAADTVNNFFTTSTPFLMEAQPVRLIGDLTGVASSPQLAKGTTYFAVQVNHGTAHNNIGLASTAANAAAGTLIDITNGGTPANYSMVLLWSTAVPSSNELTTQYPHLLSNGDEIQFHGSNLPSGLSTATTYYVIRTGHLTFRVASSYANSQTRTAITISGGTPADWGIQAYPTSGTPYQPYQLTFDGLIAQNQQCGVWLGDVNCVTIRPYFEQLKFALQVWNGTPIYLGEGRLASAANGGWLVWSQGANTLVITDEDLQYRLGTTTNTYVELNGPSVILRRVGLGTPV